MLVQSWLSTHTNRKHQRKLETLYTLRQSFLCIVFSFFGFCLAKKWCFLFEAIQASIPFNMEEDDGDAYRAKQIKLCRIWMYGNIWLPMDVTYYFNCEFAFECAEIQGIWMDKWDCVCVSVDVWTEHGASFGRRMKNWIEYMQNRCKWTDATITLVFRPNQAL